MPESVSVPTPISVSEPPPKTTPDSVSASPLLSMVSKPVRPMLFDSETVAAPACSVVTVAMLSRPLPSAELFATWRVLKKKRRAARVGIRARQDQQAVGNVGQRAAAGNHSVDLACAHQFIFEHAAAAGQHDGAGFGQRRSRLESQRAGIGQRTQRQGAAGCAPTPLSPSISRIAPPPIVVPPE